MSDYQEFVDKPRHQHWDMFDMTVEGCRFNYLDDLQSRDNFEVEKAESLVEELCGLIHSKAYADEDNFFCTMALQNEDETTDYTKALMEQHDEDPDPEYTLAIETSLKLLADSAKTPPARQLVSSLDMRFTQARQDGVFNYLDKQNEKIETKQRGFGS